MGLSNTKSLPATETAEVNNSRDSWVQYTLGNPVTLGGMQGKAAVALPPVLALKCYVISESMKKSVQKDVSPSKTTLRD